MKHYFGDSLSAAESAQDQPDRIYFPWMTAMLLGEAPPAVYAKAGALAADQTAAIYTAPAGESLILLGTNDRIVYRFGGVTTDPAGIVLFKNEMMALSYYRSGTMLTAQQPGWTPTGVWTNYLGPPWPSIGKFANSAGASLKVNFDGDLLLIGYTMIDGGNCGTAGVKVNGIPVGTINCNPPRLINGGAGHSSYAPGVFRASGFGAGSIGNFAQITTTGSPYVLIDWVYRGGAKGSPLHLLNLPFTANGDNAEVAAYNAAIAQVVAQLTADGFPVDLIDINSVVRLTEMCSNILPNNNNHPNNHGHLNITAEIIRRLAA